MWKKFIECIQMCETEFGKIRELSTPYLYKKDFSMQ